jgi:3-(3-hydroxy-phenyl)propionate hydroxylase
MSSRPVPVVIIGAGPTGIAAATLLAQYGVESLVLERWESIYPRPRAVHLDDEIYWILARLGVADEFASISRPCEASMFDHPELESLLRANLRRHPIATIRATPR